MSTIPFARSPRSIVVRIAGLLCALAIAGAPALAGNIDSTNKYAWGENVGWVNFGSTEGDVTVTDSALSGYAWGENVGWLSLNCSNTSTCGTVDYGVANDGSGTLSGYAWGENVGWVSFSCSNTSTCGTVDYGVTIDTGTGYFSGYAWGENVGWITFSCQTTGTCGTVDYRVQTSWTAGATPTPAAAGGQTVTGVAFYGASPAPSPGAEVSPTVQPGESPVATPVATLPPPSKLEPPTAPPSGGAPTTLPPSGGIGGVVDRIGQGIDSVTEAFGVIAEATYDVARQHEGTVTALAVSGFFALLGSFMLRAFRLFRSFWSGIEFLSFVGGSLARLALFRAPPVLWGAIYSSGTLQGIPFALVQIRDERGRVVARARSDIRGAYGFQKSFQDLLRETPGGRLEVIKDGYYFPGRRSDGKASYRGEPLKEVRTGSVDISLDAAASERGFSQIAVSGWVIFAMDVLFWVGLAAIPLNALVRPSTLSLSILGAFLVLTIFRMFGVRAVRR